MLLFPAAVRYGGTYVAAGRAAVNRVAMDALQSGANSGPTEGTEIGRTNA